MKIHSRSMLQMFVLLACLAGSMVFVTPVFSAIMMVTTDVDELDSGFCEDRDYSGGTGLSLAEAICIANNNGTPSDTITFLTGVDVMTLTHSLPSVTATIIINGNDTGGSTVIRANAAAGVAFARIFQVRSTGNLTLNNLNIRNGRCVSGCVTQENVGIIDPNVGGAILNHGTLSVTNSIFSGNSSTSRHGGAIYNTGGATLNVTNSTFSSNRAGDFGSGGAIFNEGAMTMTNSTLAGNYVVSGSGGGLFNSATMTLLNVTLSNNYSSNGLGGGVLNNGTLNYSNTLIANSITGGDCYNNSIIGTNIRNLVEDNSCSPAVSGDPNLGGLAQNGGPTATYALLATPTISPAINAGDNSTCASADQRGVSRPQGANCDIGAYEANDVLAEILVVPNPLDQVMTTNRLEIRPLSLKNIGGVNLDWTVFEATDSSCVPADLSWLNIAPANGITAAGNADTIDVTFDSTGVALGDYSGTLCFDSNDPFQPQLKVPVVLNVSPGMPLACNSATMDFESGIPPAYYRTAAGNADVKWVTTADDGSCRPNNETPGSGEAACVDSDLTNPEPAEAYDARLSTNSFDLSPYGTARLEFAAAYKDSTLADKFDVDISIDAGSTWTNELSWNEQHNNPGENVTINLAAYLGQADVRVRFRYYGEGWDWWAQVDDISLKCSSEEIFNDGFEVDP